MPSFPITVPARVAVGVAILVGSCLVWFMFVPGSGAIALVIPARSSPSEEPDG